MTTLHENFAYFQQTIKRRACVSKKHEQERLEGVLEHELLSKLMEIRRSLIYYFYVFCVMLLVHVNCNTYFVLCYLYTCKGISLSPPSSSPVKRPPHEVKHEVNKIGVEKLRH